ncbi:S-layer homology domain-containing protein [Paenibacillus sp. HB172176]|uniref:S-layer homology domain-containing protein n=1 Tax=Paenibacillus sp. HB172176 TaxID=2493690 RepID=UPI0014399F54|nr:S-layer homology domain-containing protein [Paenibacillus sp. HB172176]
MKVTKMGILIAVVALIWAHAFSPIPANAAEGTQQLQAGQAVGQNGAMLDVPIMLKSNGEVTALQLQLDYDRDAFALIEVKKGRGLASSFEVLSNLDNGKVVIGSIDSSIADGLREVAVASFRIKADAPDGKYAIKLTNTAFTDREARNLSSQFRLVDGSITVGAGNGDDGGGNNNGDGDSEGGGETSASPGSEPTVELDAQALVNGKTAQIGKAVTSQVRGKTKTTVTVDSQRAANLLAMEADKAQLTLPMPAPSDVNFVVLDGQLLQLMEQKQVVIEMRTDNASYTLTAEQLRIAALAEQWGEAVNLQDMQIQIEISLPSKETTAAFEESASEVGFTLLTSPVQFTVQAVYDSQTKEITDFPAYVERGIALPQGTNPTLASTVVILEPDGSVRHVPTRIIDDEGTYYALASSLTNSVYAVISHQQAFQDMDGHWSQTVVDDLSSRMVLSGTSKSRFQPDRPITRAEFAAILVRALGLKQESGSSSFTDVAAESWYSEAVRTASEYSLINGFEDQTFRPADNVTREQAMVMLANAMPLTGLTAGLSVETTPFHGLDVFTDAANTSDWARNGVARSLQAELVSGRSSAELAPQANVTRAETAAMVWRLLERSGLI